MQINFYILSKNRQLTAFVCQLVQTILAKSDEKILIFAHAELLQQLDDVLWSFEPSSFIPHDCFFKQISQQISQQIPTNSPVLLTDDEQLLSKHSQMVLNLSNTALRTFHGTKLLEIIDNNPQIVQAGREKYRYYQQNFANIPIQTFKIA